MNLVVDTSTIIRGLLKKYTEPAEIVERVMKKEYTLLMTDEMSKELLIAIYMMCVKSEINPKKYLRAAAVFTLNAQKVEKKTVFKSCSDPDDSMFIECSIDGNAKYCVASDPSIYDIKSYCKDPIEMELIKDIEFYTPQKFYEIVVNEKTSTSTRPRKN